MEPYALACVQCLAEPATISVKHRHRVVPFCTPACSDKFCCAAVRRIGPKYVHKPTVTGQAGEDAKRKPYARDTEESFGSTDVFVFFVKRPSDGKKIGIRRYMEMFTPNSDDLLNPQRVARAPETVAWVIEADFDAFTRDYEVPDSVVRDIDSDRHSSQTVANLAVRYEPSQSNYLMLHHFANFMTGPSIDQDDREAFRGVATYLLRTVLVYILDRYPWMLPNKRDSMVGLEAGSMRLASSIRRDQLNQQALVQYYTSIGFRPDEKVPRKKDNIKDTIPMSARVGDLLGETKAVLRT